MSASGHFTPLRLALASTAVVALGGCTTLGGNVKGSFACAAPDGICAPSSSIDDRALAMIAGEGEAGSTAPVAPVADPSVRRRPARTAAANPRSSVVAADTGRTQERVLRIVFQPYIDEYGRLHEASAIHAVVEGGAWRPQALAATAALPASGAASIVAPDGSLVEAVDRAEAGGAGVAAYDPNLPDPAVVAAARARAPAPDPIAAIKSDVAARLSPKTGRAPRRALSKSNYRVTGLATNAAALKPPLPSRTGARSAGDQTTAVSKSSAMPSPAPGETSADAAARVRARPQVQDQARAAESAARIAPMPGAPSDPKPASKAPVRAAGFPAGVRQDD